jgi:hypothetical protein
MNLRLFKYAGRKEFYIRKLIEFAQMRPEDVPMQINIMLQNMNLYTLQNYVGPAVAKDRSILRDIDRFTREFKGYSVNTETNRSVITERKE